MLVKAKSREEVNIEEVNIVSLNAAYQRDLRSVGLTDTISFLFASIECMLLCVNGRHTHALLTQEGGATPKIKAVEVTNVSTSSRRGCVHC